MELSPGHLVRVVCAPAQAAGFCLAGLQVDVAPDMPRALEVLRTLCADVNVGVVLVDQTLHAALPVDFRRRLERQARPMVTPFPAPVWNETAAAEEYVLEILRQAIGYRVRPR